MGAAPYDLPVTMTDDETPQFTLEWVMDDATGFPWSDYVVEYSIGPENCRRRTPLTAPGAVTIDPTGNLITFDLTSAGICRGRYEHGCRITNNDTGVETQVFDGLLVVSEGNFR